MKICVNLGFAVSFLAGLFHSNPCWFATWWRWRSCWVSGMGDLDYGMPLLVLEWSTWFNVSCRILQIDKESFIQICLMPAILGIECREVIASDHQIQQNTLLAGTRQSQSDDLGKARNAASTRQDNHSHRHHQGFLIGSNTKGRPWSLLRCKWR